MVRTGLRGERKPRCGRWCGYPATIPMLIVGLSGGIACGKSAVSARLSSHHRLTVVDLDELARRVVAPGRTAHRRIVDRFGAGVLRADGSVDRDALGALIFTDRSARRALNSITHLPILWELLCDLASAHAAGARIVVLDAPLLFESSLHLLCGTTVVVHVATSAQLERLKLRDGRTDEEAEQRIAAQMPLSTKVARADHLIDNNGHLKATHALVDGLVVQLAAQAATWSFRGLVQCALLALAACVAGLLRRCASPSPGRGMWKRRQNVLVVVDMQRDYDTTANMALYGSVRSPYANPIHRVVPHVNRIRQAAPWDRVVFTYDWLPAEMLSGRTPFCAAGSAGAELLEGLDVRTSASDVHFKKDSDDSFCEQGGLPEADTGCSRLADVLTRLGYDAATTELTFVGQRFERCMLKSVRMRGRGGGRSASNTAASPAPPCCP